MAEFTEAQRKICETLEQLQKAQADAKKTAFDTFKKALKVIGIFIFGLGWLDALKDLGTLVSQAALAAASQVVAAAATAASNIVKLAIQMLMEALLTMFLLGPSAIISIVAMPVQRAKLHGKKERDHLIKAQRSMNSISSLFLSLIDVGQDPDKYIRQMREAVRKLNPAIENLKKIVDGLETDDYFDNSLYTSAMSGLEAAIDATLLNDTYSRNFRNNLDNTKAAKRADLDKRMRAEIKALNDTRNTALEATYDKYESAILAPIKSGDTSVAVSKTLRDANAALEFNDDRATIQEKVSAQPGYILDTEIINRKADTQIQAVKLRYNRDKEISDAEAWSSSTSSVSSMMDTTWRSVIDEKTIIIELIVQEAIAFGKHIGSAYIYYQKRAAATRGAYIVASQIKPLIKFILSLLTKSIDMLHLDEGVIATINGALKPITKARDSMDREISQYEGGNIFTALYLATKILQQNGLIKFGHAMLNATISQALIDLINSDNIFADFEDEVKEMQKDIRSIPTFYSDDPWINDLKVTPPRLSPYTGLLKQAASLAAKAPAVALGSTTQKKAFQSTLSKANDSISTLLRHNANSYAVLNKYDFPIHQSMTSLVSGLNAMGAVNVLALLETGLLVQSVSMALKGFISNTTMCSKMWAEDGVSNPLANSNLDSTNRGRDSSDPANDADRSDLLHNADEEHIRSMESELELNTDPSQYEVGEDRVFSN